MNIKFLILTMLCANVSANQFAVVGVDQDANEVVEFVKIPAARREMVKYLSGVQEEVRLKVSNEDIIVSGWKMNKFSVGLSLDGEVGIGPWSLGAGVKQRMFFKKQ